VNGKREERGKQMAGHYPILQGQTEGTPQVDADSEAMEIVQEITDDMLTRHKMGYCWPGQIPMQEIISKHLRKHGVHERRAARCSDCA
jgi:hypothetical protein